MLAALDFTLEIVFVAAGRAHPTGKRLALISQFRHQIRTLNYVVSIPEPIKTLRKSVAIKRPVSVAAFEAADA